VEAITGLLRGEIGFDGVVVADYLGMAAVTSLTDQPTAAVWSLIAGADLLIVGDDQSAAASVVMVRSVALAIETALDEGSLSVTRLNEAVGRVFVLRQSDPCQVLLNL
jgi:beta-N-acetylhexosaminidase